MKFKLKLTDQKPGPFKKPLARVNDDGIRRARTQVVRPAADGPKPKKATPVSEAQDMIDDVVRGDNPGEVLEGWVRGALHHIVAKGTHKHNRRVSRSEHQVVASIRSRGRRAFHGSTGRLMRGQHHKDD